MPQVGAGAVAVVPTFKGFRRNVESEVDGAAKSADRGFRRIFSKTGDESGKEAGRGFKRSFESQSTGFASKGTRELEQAVAKTARALSTARLQEQDAAGKVRVAESQLAEARGKYAADSSQVVRAEERLATANRQVQIAQGRTEDSTQSLRAAQARLADSANESGERFVSSWRRANDRVGDVFKGSFLGTAAANIVTGAASSIGRNIGEALRGGLDLALGSIDIASDLNESVNAVRVSYGAIADQVLTLGQNSARTFGLSKRDLNAYAVQFSSFAKTIAGDGGDVAGSFQSILGRATDFASVMNLEVAESLQLFQSGLAGETEPLRRYGIDLSAAAVQAHAYASGIGTVGTELTEAEKVQARYSLLLQQTNQVAGDFANTSDELANKQRIQAAMWDDVQARIGTAFLPVAQEVTSLLTDELLPTLASLAEEHGPALAQAFEDAMPSFEKLLDEVLPKLPELIDSVATSLPVVIDLLTTALPPLIDFLGSLANGASQINDFFTGATANFENGGTQLQEFFGSFSDPEVWSNWANGKTQIEDFFTGLGDNLENGGSQIGGFFEGVGTNLQNGGNQWGSFFAGLGANLENGKNQLGSFAATVGVKIDEAINWIRGLPGRALEALGNLRDDLVSSGRALMDGFIQGIKDSPVGEAVSGVIDFARGFFPNSPAKRGPLSGSGWTSLRESGGAVMEQWTSGFGRPDLTAALTPAFAVAGAAVHPALSGAAGAGAGMPGTLVVVDQDGQLIGRMRVEAGQVVRSSQQQTAVGLSSGEASR